MMLLILYPGLYTYIFLSEYTGFRYITSQSRHVSAVNTLKIKSYENSTVPWLYIHTHLWLPLFTFRTCTRMRTTSHESTSSCSIKFAVTPVLPHPTSSKNRAYTHLHKCTAKTFSYTSSTFRYLGAQFDLWAQRVLRSRYTRARGK